MSPSGSFIFSPQTSSKMSSFSTFEEEEESNNFSSATDLESILAKERKERIKLEERLKAEEQKSRNIQEKLDAFIEYSKRQTSLFQDIFQNLIFQFESMEQQDLKNGKDNSFNGFGFVSKYSNLRKSKRGIALLSEMLENLTEENISTTNGDSNSNAVSGNAITTTRGANSSNISSNSNNLSSNRSKETNNNSEVKRDVNITSGPQTPFKYENSSSTSSPSVISSGIVKPSKIEKDKHCTKCGKLIWNWVCFTLFTFSLFRNKLKN